MSPRLFRLAAPLLGAMSLLALPGCNTFDFLSRTAVEGVVLGAAVTDGETPLSGGPTFGAVFLGEATSINDFADNVIEDAESVTLADDQGEAELGFEEPGLWLTNDVASQLTWETGEEVVLELVRGGETFTASAVAPPPPTLSGVPQVVSIADLPDDWSTLTEEDLEALAAQAESAEFQPVGQGLTVTLGGDYEYWAILVVNQDGDLTYSSLPGDASGLVDYVLESEPITSWDIPGEAFPEPETLYAVAAAGVEFTSTQNYAGFNWLISNLGIGTMTVAPLVTEGAR